MQRAVSVAVLAAMCWLLFGAHDASWARQQPAAVQREISDKVRLISPGTEIKVFLTGRRVLEGRLREVQDDAIVVDHKKGGGSTRVLLTEIERLQTKEKGRSAVTYVLIGAAVAVGVIIVLAVSACSVSTAAQQRG
jgi:hypothetical protein